VSDLGTMGLEFGGRVDFARLRSERRHRLLGAMKGDGLDALLLGREANARYAAGARRLWSSGLRPFGPGCIVLREPEQVHLLAGWDWGVPPEVPREHLFLPSWNPARLGEGLARLPGLAEARRVGIDGMTPLWAGLLADALPRAELVDAGPTLWRARRIKTPEELACIETAIALSEAALAAVTAELRPGLRECELQGRFAEAAARLGVTTPALAGTFCATPRSAGGGFPLRRLPSQAELAAGELVAFDVGLLYAGYEGGLARTWPCLAAGAAPSAAQRDLLRRWREILGALLAECRPGRSAADLERAHAACGEPAPPFPVASGVGLGLEPPLAGRPDDPPQARLEEGMVLSLQAYVHREGVGGLLGRELALVTAEGPALLTRAGHGPLAD
jgi:Xaa-Pro aminopeptidase